VSLPTHLAAALVEASTTAAVEGTWRMDTSIANRIIDQRTIRAITLRDQSQWSPFHRRSRDLVSSFRDLDDERQCIEL
jgi:hypothetical protein